MIEKSIKTQALPSKTSKFNEIVTWTRICDTHGQGSTERDESWELCKSSQRGDI